MSEKKGKVYIVGAGPGDVAYMTVRSHFLVSQSEVLIYDALVDDSILELAPANTQKLPVGKRGGEASTSQSEINRLLVEQCNLGKQVVRLKGGDPFIFGRTTTEIQALISARCEFEIVPGISSALAASLFAAIPLTDPVMSRCFAVLTAHDPEALDWERVSQIETLVILMGGRNLKEIVRQLLRHERTPQTPVAIIRNCATSQQKIWIGNLANIVTKTGDESLSPAAIIVGEVVGLRDYLKPPNRENIFVSDRSSVTVYSQEAAAKKNRDSARKSQDKNEEKLPLIGKIILITRAAGQSSKFSDLLLQTGAKVIEMPALVITAPSSWQPLDEAISNIANFNWLILTSSNGVDYFFDRLIFRGKDSRALAALKIAVVGKKTAESLKSRYLAADFIPPNFIADSLVANFPGNLAGSKILFPRVETGGRDVLVKELTDKGAEVTEVPAYESGCPDEIAPDALAALQNKAMDVITFASSKTVKNFCQLVEGNKERLPEDLLSGICIASIGPQTSDSCQSLLGRVDVEAKEFTLDGLTEAIIQWAAN